jgi:uncharacterized protein with PIN domain
MSKFYDALTKLEKKIGAHSPTVFSPNWKHVPDRQRPTCPNCQSSDTRLSHRRNFRERAVSWIRIRFFRCNECGTRFWFGLGRIRNRSWL